MRSVIIAIVVSLGATVAVSAQQATAPKAKIATAKRCTPAACIARGAKMGYSASTAADWCARNNNGCK